VLLAVVLLSCGWGCGGAKELNMPIVLLTAFGSGDYRVAALKGIVYSNYPEAEIIDATHDVPAFDVQAGVYILGIAAREFPERTVFIAVVDPGAAEERYLILTTNKHQVFLLPDNGLLTRVVDQMGIETLYKISNQDLFDKPIESLSVTSILGKVGALTASGYHPEDVGPAVDDPETSDVQEAAIVNDKLIGMIVFIDQFGNCLTNIPLEKSNEFGLTPGNTVQVTTPEGRITAEFGSTYADVPEGEVVILANRQNLMIELAIIMGVFDETYDIRSGNNIEIQR